MGMVAWPEILASIGCFFFLLCLRNWKYSSPLMKWPVAGMLPSLILNIHQAHDWSTQLLLQSGWTVLFEGPWFSNMNMICTSDPANVRYMLNTNFSNFPKGSEFKEIFDVLGDGIFNSDLDMWRVQRKIGHALINHSRFLRFLERTSWEKVENGLVPVLEHVAKQGLVVDLQDVFKRFTLDTTYILVAGVDLGCLAVDMTIVPFAEALDDVLQILFYRYVTPQCCWKLQRWIEAGREKKLRKAWETLDHYIGQCITMRREQLSRRGKIKEGDEGFDLLTSYLTTEELKGLQSDKFLRDTVVNYMVAGRDTVSSALTWFFWLLSKNPSVETKIMEELVANSPMKNLKEQRRTFEIKELSRLVYLHGALCECLRLFPPVPFEHKSPIQQDILPSGHKVNSKSRILIFLYAMGRIKEIWGQDCLEFKPERWISREGRIKYESPYKFLAFNAGPRICLGKEVAFTQMKLVVATLVYNYHFEVVEGHPVAPKNSIILHMRHGLLVRMKRRLV